MKTKHALMVAFHFPPQTGSSGVQRTLSFSKRLQAQAWHPLVLSANPRAYATHNPAQLASLPADLIVCRAFALDTKRHLGLGGRYSELMALPDRWISWWGHGVLAGLRLIRQHKPSVLWSTFPIATAHLIALTLHRITGLPWIADFRDPMLQPAHPVSERQRRIYGWLEKQTLQRCRFAVFTTENAMNAYRARFPHIDANKFRVIENGYDEDDFTASSAGLAPVVNARTTLLHSGILYDAGRNPEQFLAALAQLKRAGRIDASLRVVLRAPGDIPATIDKVRRHGVEDIVDVLPPVAYRDALHEMLSADGLLIFQGTPYNNQIPAKIYEYFRARKPILGLVDAAGETAGVLRQGGFDTMAPIDDTALLAPAIADFVDAVRGGSAHRASEELVAQSSRTHKAVQLAQLFDEAAR
jgi:glycosyltransferase involved in cell wall biosynthesis